MLLTYGYVTYTGKVLHPREVDAYNQHQARCDELIKKAGTNPSPLAQRGIDFALDQKHRFFVAISAL